MIQNPLTIKEQIDRFDYKEIKITNHTINKDKSEMTNWKKKYL